MKQRPSAMDAYTPGTLGVLHLRPHAVIPTWGHCDEFMKYFRQKIGDIMVSFDLNYSHFLQKKIFRAKFFAVGRNVFVLTIAQ
jgi:hypothetical protein